MKVLFLVGTLETGGLERFVTNMSLRAARGGEFDPSVLCLIRKTGAFVKHLERAGVRVYGVSPRWTRDLRAAAEFARTVRAIGPDLIHSQVNFALLQQLLAARIGVRCPFCVTERSCYERSGLSLIRRRIQFWLLKGFGVDYSANSNAVAKHLAEQVGISQHLIPVLPNGVSKVTPAGAARKRLRLEIGVEETDILLGSVGRLSDVKGHALTLDAYSELVRSGLPVHLCFVGDGPMRLELETLVKERNLGDRVIFAGEVRNVDDYLSAIDVLVVSSSREGMPNAVLEGMVSGKAIVATRVGAVPELLADGECGLLLEQRTVNCLSSALVELCNNEPLRHSLGGKAKNRANSLYSLEQAFETLLQHYRGLVNH